jgi:hypothetical protein
MSVQTLSCSGLVTDSTALQLSRPPDQAVLGPKGWSFGSFATPSSYEIAFPDDQGKLRIASIEVENDSAPEILRRPMMHASSTGIAVNTARIPFSRRLLVADSRYSGEFAGGEAPEELEDSVVYEPEWRALALLSLDRGWIQTLADLRSDRRVIVVFDNSGVEVRRLEMDAPFGFVASSHDSQEVVALRALGKAELIFYRWTWGAE